LRILALLTLVALLAPVLPGQSIFSFQYDDEERRWSLSNGQIELTLRLTPDGQLRFGSLARPGREPWRASELVPISPIRLSFQEKATQTRPVQDVVFDANTSYRLIRHSVSKVERDGLRQTIELAESGGIAHFKLELIL
jgi:hypothetical protein